MTILACLRIRLAFCFLLINKLVPLVKYLLNIVIHEGTFSFDFGLFLEILEHLLESDKPIIELAEDPFEVLLEPLGMSLGHDKVQLFSFFGLLEVTHTIIREDLVGVVSFFIFAFFEDICENFWFENCMHELLEVILEAF